MTSLDVWLCLLAILLAGVACVGCNPMPPESYSGIPTFPAPAPYWPWAHFPEAAASVVSVARAEVPDVPLDFWVRVIGPHERFRAALQPPADVVDPATISGTIDLEPSDPFGVGTAVVIVVRELPRSSTAVLDACHSALFYEFADHYVSMRRGQGVNPDVLPDGGVIADPRWAPLGAEMQARCLETEGGGGP